MIMYFFDYKTLMEYKDIEEAEFSSNSSIMNDRNELIQSINQKVKSLKDDKLSEFHSKFSLACITLFNLIEIKKELYDIENKIEKNNKISGYSVLFFVIGVILLSLISELVIKPLILLSTSSLLIWIAVISDITIDKTNKFTLISDLKRELKDAHLLHFDEKLVHEMVKIDNILDKALIDGTDKEKIENNQIISDIKILSLKESILNHCS